MISKVEVVQFSMNESKWHRCMEYVPEFGPRTKVEVLVGDSQVKQIIDGILKVISTGSASDGKIFGEQR